MFVPCAEEPSHLEERIREFCTPYQEARFVTSCSDPSAPVVKKRNRAIYLRLFFTVYSTAIHESRMRSQWYLVRFLRFWQKMTILNHLGVRRKYLAENFRSTLKLLSGLVPFSRFFSPGQKYSPWQSGQTDNMMQHHDTIFCLCIQTICCLEQEVWYAQLNDTYLRNP